MKDKITELLKVSNEDANSNEFPMDEVYWDLVSSLWGIIEEPTPEELSVDWPEVVEVPHA